MRPAATFVNYTYTTIITQQSRLLGTLLIVICQHAAREPGVALCHGLTHGDYCRYWVRKHKNVGFYHHTRSANVMRKILTTYMDLFLPKQC
jgi:hypothetical protein